MKKSSKECGFVITQLKRFLPLVILGAILMHLQGSQSAGQTGRVIDIRSRSAGHSRESWAASVAVVLEYATGHRMEPCQLVTLAALPYLDNSKRLSACCEIDEPNINRVCQDSAIKNYFEMATFLSEKLGVRNEVVVGAASFKEIVESIANDRPVIIWLEKTRYGNTYTYAVVVYGYSGSSLVVLDPVRLRSRGLRSREKREESIDLVPYSELAQDDAEVLRQGRRLPRYYNYYNNHKWTGTIFLLDSPSVKTPQWISSNENLSYPGNAIQAGIENNQRIYVCRTEGQIGKLAGGKCYITSSKYEERSTSNYEILIGDQVSTSWGAPSKGYVGTLNLNNEPSRGSLYEAFMPTSFLCRTSQDGTIFLGTVSGYQCAIINKGERLYVKDFETLNFNRPFTRELPVAALEAELNQEIGNAENKFRESTTQLVLIRGTLPDGGSLEGYDVNQVKQIIEQGKLWLRLEEPAFAGMKAYVARFYPLANNLVTFKVRVEQKSGKSDVKSKEPRIEINTNHLAESLFAFQEDKGNVLAAPASVQAVIAAVFSFFAKLRENVKAINLSVVSEPDEAGVELRTASGKVRTTRTNSKFTNVFRGLYTYAVKKSGYKAVQQELNLIDEAGTTLNCKLYSSTGRDGPYPCSLQ